MLILDFLWLVSWFLIVYVISVNIKLLVNTGTNKMKLIFNVLLNNTLLKHVFYSYNTLIIPMKNKMYLYAFFTFLATIIHQIACTKSREKCWHYR